MCISLPIHTVHDKVLLDIYQQQVDILLSKNQALQI